jgi:DNA-binding transcriptional ArsR family regulator
MRTTVDSARLDRMFFALSDAQRRGMLDRLSKRPTSVTELAEPLGMALASAVKHLAVLEQGGFVSSSKIGRIRTYQVEPEAFDAMQAWVAKRRKQLDAQFDRLDAYLAAQKSKATR